MALLQGKCLLLSRLLMLLSSMTPSVSSHSRHYTAPSVTRLTDLFSHVSIDQAFNKVFGASNIQLMSNGSSAYISLNKTSGDVFD
ncbi:hypothetical protein CRG98_036983 [Punica granatum]|uniref:Uncharacterized protein n=1 Tax=Punica granatum TaxID=22663 RepID=A0A2I0IFB2_PUNGR|nr:hypothetical protein CRG98_036983 [Punica granatum]